MAKTAPADTGNTILLRKARTGDVPAMHRLINHYADQDLMLHRSLSELYENIRDFVLVEEAGVFAGCAGVHVSWRDLAELKSLAVDDRFRGKGFGRMLIEASIEEARLIGISRLFALTYVPGIFEKCGFHIVDKANMPRKVWTECVYCPKFPDCGEIAVQILLGTNTDQSSMISLELQPR